MTSWINLAYLLATILFIIGIKGLSSPKSAPRGNQLGAFGMFIAIVATLLDQQVLSYQWIILGILIGSVIGMVWAIKVPMTGMPQMVAILNGLGGGASLLVASAAYLEMLNSKNDPGYIWSTAASFSTLIGAVTLTGSLVAFLKLQEWLKDFKVTPALSKGIVLSLVSLALLAAIFFCIEPVGAPKIYALLVILSLVLGIFLVIPVGGADAPVVIALLNSYSGIAAAATGFVLNNNGLIISGSLVGASGLILTSIMCKAMNRSLANVIFGGSSPTEGSDKVPGKEFYDGKVKSSDAEEVAMMLDSAQKVIFVPGYGLAVAQAQHATRELASLLTAKGIDVKYAIHPVAGRMPGHMNVLLAEAEVPYEQLYDMDSINSEFSDTDVSIVLGANDVINPSAGDEPNSPIYGMPILDVHKSKSVVIVKRSLSPGFAGIPNKLFIQDNSLMVFGDGKKVLQDLISAIKEL